MYFLYCLILCYTSTLLTPVNSYVVLAANLNDFRTIARKFVPTDLVNQIKVLVLENGHKYYREPPRDDKQVYRSEEYEEISKHDENSYEFAADLKAALAKQLKNGYKLKKAPKVKFVEPIRLPQVKQATVITLNDIVEKVKAKLLKEFLESGHALGSQVYNNVINKYAKPQVKKPVYNSVPMKVLKEEVQFEGSYEDTTDDKPHMQYYSEYYKPIPNKSPTNNNNYPFIYGNNVIPQKNRYDGPKKVRFVKQVLVPERESVHVSQSSFQQPSMVQQPLHQPHENIASQLALMQLQINELIKNTQHQGLTKKPALESPRLNIEAIDAHFHLLPHESDIKEDKNKTNDSQEDQDEPTDDTSLSEETAIEPAIREINTKPLTEPGVVENEQFDEEADPAISEENVEDATENKPEEITENEPEQITENEPEQITENEPEQITENEPEQITENEPEQITENEPEEITQINSAEGENAETDLSVDNNAKAEDETKTHTQEFGNPNAGEPIVARTYNFNAPTNKADGPPQHINIPVNSARKVMLF